MANGVFSFDEDVPGIDGFQYDADAASPEDRLINNRVRPDGVTLFEFISDVDLSKEKTSDGCNIGEVLSNWAKTKGRFTRLTPPARIRSLRA
jgi:hypothetical protein